MALTLGDLFKLPQSVNEELERRSDLRAEALASKILNKVTGEEIVPNPLSFNQYYQNSDNTNEMTSQKSNHETNTKKNWGGGGW